MHLLRAIFVHHDIGDAAHQVFAERNLGIHGGLGGQHLARAQVTQIDRHRRAADIHRQAIDTFGVPGSYVEHLLVIPDHAGQIPLALAQGQLQTAQGQQVDGQPGELPLLRQRVLEPAPIAPMLTQLRLVHADKDLAHRRVDVDHPLRRRLADHLLLGAALFGHEDQQVAGHFCRAGEPAVVCMHVVEQQPLCLAGRRQMVGLRSHAVFGEGAFFYTHFTLAAGQSPAADALDAETQLTRRLQERRTFGKTAAPTRRHKNDQRSFICHATTPFRLVSI